MKKSKTMKNLILISLYIFLILAFLVIWQYHKPNEPKQDEWSLLRIQDLTNPEQILWFQNKLLVVKNKTIKEFDFATRSFKDFEQINNNEILAELNNELVFVKYVNHVIYSPEEFATDVAIFNLDRQEIFSQSFHETVKPLHIEGDFLILMDNYLNSPERTYKIDLNVGNIESSEMSEGYTIQGDESISILKGEQVLVNIPKVNDIRSFSPNENFDKIALIDFEGNIWIYFKKSK